MIDRRWKFVLEDRSWTKHLRIGHLNFREFEQPNFRKFKFPGIGGGGGQGWVVLKLRIDRCMVIFGAGALNNPSLLSSWARKRERAGASQK